MKKSSIYYVKGDNNKMKIKNIKMLGMTFCIIGCVTGCSTLDQKEQEIGQSIEQKIENHTEENTEQKIGQNTENIQKSALTMDDAKKRAIEYMEIDETIVTDSFVEEDEEDGILTYDITMIVPDKKYECVIQREDGVLLSLEYETLSYPTSQTGQTISREKAKQIMIEEIGSGVREDNIFLEEDRDDGRFVYEGKIQIENRQYEVELDGYSGEILKFKQELEHNLWD